MKGIILSELLKNQNDYLAEINNSLQTSLGIRDTKLLSTGPLSVLANLMANISFDAQKYYEYVTKEFNVATAQQYKSMLFHASVYSYNFKLAIPATVDLILMIPKVVVENTYKLVYNIPNFTTFELNNTIFRISGEIDITINSTLAAANLKFGSNLYQLDINESSYNGTPMYFITVPKDYVIQVNRMVEKFVVPEYNIGDTVGFNVELPKNNQLYKIKAFVNSHNNSPIDETDLENIAIDQISNQFAQLDEYKIKYFKFDTLPTEKVIFMDSSSIQNISFTLGNQIYGHKLSTNDELFVILEYSKGDGGNVSPGDTQIENVYFYKINLETDDTVIFNTTSIKAITTTPASGGKNQDDINDIRFNILKNITERKSLITQLDFQKYFSDPITRQLACVVSRQVSTASPLVSVYNVLRDPYSYEILKTNTLNKASSDCYTDEKPWCIEPTVTYNNMDLISPFIYIKYNSQIVSYYMYKKTKIPLTIIKIEADPELSISLTVNWDTTNEDFYFESDNLSSDYNIKIESNVGTYVLDDSNNFIQSISDPSMLYDRFFKNTLKINKVSIIRVADNFAVHTYSVTDEISVMEKVQQHPEYEFPDGTLKTMFMPFITTDYYNSMSLDDKYVKNFIDFFSIKNPDVNQMKAYNIALNQSFMNTIDADNVTQQGVKINYNDQLLAEYPVDIDIIFDLHKMETKGLTLFNLKNDTQLAVLDYLSSIQGNAIKYYDTTLIKLIKNLYPDVILEVKINSPLSLVVDGWEEIQNENSFTADEILSSTPTYFHFDLNNMNIKFQMS